MHWGEIMTKIVCDICGENIESGNSYKLNLRIDDDVKAVFPTNKEVSIDNMDLCRKCADNLDIHISVLKSRYGKR